MLLDPLEEQLDLPALAVQLGDQLGFEGEVVGQKRNALARLFLDYHAARGCRVTLRKDRLFMTMELQPKPINLGSYSNPFQVV